MVRCSTRTGFKTGPGAQRPHSSSSVMEGSRVSDFSIERILSPQLGHKPPVLEASPDRYLQGFPAGFSPDSGSFRPPAMSVPGCLQYRGMGFGEAFYPCGAGFHHADFSRVYSNPGVYVHFSSQEPADAQQLVGYHGYQQPQPRHRSRMRTVFTDGQTKRLEALFELTDYPTVEARADVARSTGLSEETVRVWFKNRRARRKRQRSGSQVKSPSPPRSAGAEKTLLSTFL